MNFFRKLENLCRYLNGILYATNARMKKIRALVAIILFSLII